MPHDDQVNQDQSRNHGGDGRREASHDREEHHDDGEPPGPAAQVEESDADPDPDEAEHEHDRANDARGQAEGERQSNPNEDQRGNDEQEPEADNQDTKEDCEDSEESYADRPGRRRGGAGWGVTGRRGGHGSVSGRSEQATGTPGFDERFRKGDPPPGEGAPGWERAEGERPSLPRRSSN